MRTNEHKTKGKQRRAIGKACLGVREGEDCGSYFPTGLGAPGGRENCGVYPSLPALGAENSALDTVVRRSRDEWKQ